MHDINDVGYAYIQNGTRASYSDTASTGVYLGADGISLGRTGTGTQDDPYEIPFMVNSNGALTATNATIEGDITATSGTFTGTVYASDGTFTGSIYASEGTIAGWNIKSTYIGTSEDSAAESKTGIGTGSNNTDYVFWAGNVTPSGQSASLANSKFSVKANGELVSTKGSIGGWNIDSNYLGDNTSLNTSYVGMRSVASTDETTTKVFWAGGAYNGTGANEPKFYVQKDGTVTCNNLNMIGGTITAANITLGSTSTTLDQIATDAANVEGLIDGTTAVKKLSSTGISVDTNGIIVSGQRYIKLDVDTDNYVHIDEDGVSLKGSRSINLDIDADTHVHMGPGGIELKGNRITFVDTAGNEVEAWGRDDIIIMKPPAALDYEDEATIVARQNAKNRHDWVLISPTYSSTGLKRYYKGNPYDVSSSPARRQGYFDLDTSRTHDTFSPGGTYNYTFSIQMTNSTPYASGNIVVYMSSVAFDLDMTKQESTRRTAAYAHVNDYGGIAFSQKSFSIGAGGKNTWSVGPISSSLYLCADNAIIYYYISISITSDSQSEARLTIKPELLAQMGATDTKIPCNVYYYP